MQTNYLHHPFYCYTEDLFAFFSCAILTEWNLRSLSEPSYYFVMVPSFFPDVVFPICFYCYSILTSCLLFIISIFTLTLYENAFTPCTQPARQHRLLGNCFSLFKNPRWCCLSWEQSSWDPSQLSCSLPKLFSNCTFLLQERDLAQGCTLCHAETARSLTDNLQEHP